MDHLVVRSVLTPNTLCTSWFEGRLSALGTTAGFESESRRISGGSTADVGVVVAVADGGGGFSFLVEKAVIDPTTLTRLCGTGFSLHSLGNDIIFRSSLLEASMTRWHGTYHF
jgi:hypothetical protein